MKTTLVLLAFLGACVQGTYAQRDILRQLQTDQPGQGKVRIVQDDAIARLVGSTPATTSAADFNALLSTDTPVETKRTVKARGYRIQVYAGNNSRRAKNEAYGVGNRIKEQFPDIAVYTYFQSPRWLCRVGDYRSMEEAYAALRQLKREGGFKEVSIVKETINLPVE